MKTIVKIIRYVLFILMFVCAITFICTEKTFYIKMICINLLIFIFLYVIENEIL